MAFDSLADFIAMGGHARYVWAAWGVTLLMLLALTLFAWFEQRLALRVLRRHLRRTPTLAERQVPKASVTLAQAPTTQATLQTSAQASIQDGSQDSTHNRSAP
ncbi:heme exporter protein CcmD [Halomonas dongshanensis]|uniref:Heme exporter protein D n=1 Tax=Halomonas dongshanensis TaxID=2890835 RepID=A0ABT2EA83_9GAMM|nr:heme exporter protein CcmD [Halomonas dongshanensis]MCS2608439.1 heme exporter protein CcmD [Halomonas dongshanensis]